MERQEAFETCLGRFTFYQLVSQTVIAHLSLVSVWRLCGAARAAVGLPLEERLLHLGQRPQVRPLCLLKATMQGLLEDGTGS